MKISFIIPIILFGACTLQSKAQVDDRTKSKMFCYAINNLSTAPNYLVVKVKNQKTGEIKEICTEAPFLEGAIGQETGKWNLNCKNSKSRYFVFSQDSALRNIDYDLYTKSELDSYSKTINLNDIVHQIKIGHLTSKIFTGDRKEQVMFAHLMFNNGIMMTRGCIAGNICELSYFK